MLVVDNSFIKQLHDFKRGRYGERLYSDTGNCMQKGGFTNVVDGSMSCFTGEVESKVAWFLSTNLCSV